MAFQTPETFPATASFPAVASFPSPASFPSAYDPDAVTYFTASGVTDPTQKLNISQFFTGLKAMGMWNALIDGYTHRSTQNAGTGTVDYGFRGNNGTLVNGPTWGTSGITMAAASSQYISLPNTKILLNNLNWEVCHVVFHNTLTATEQTYYAVGIGANAGPNVGQQASGHYVNNVSIEALSGVGGDIVAIGTPPSVSTRTILFLRGSSTGQGNTSYTSPANTPATSNLANAQQNPLSFTAAIGAGRGRFFDGVVSATFLFRTQFSSNSSRDAFIALYKRTIGQGLGLP